MKQKYLLALSGVIVIAAVVVLTLLQVHSVRSGPQASTPTPTYGSGTSQLNSNGTNVLPAMPTAVQPKITDLAPNVPYEDKPSVVIQHADGSREMFLLAPDQVDAFLKNLPTGDKLSLVIPPPSASTTHEAP
jgi:hypothetical protein